MATTRMLGAQRIEAVCERVAVEKLRMRVDIAAPVLVHRHVPSGIIPKNSRNDLQLPG